jgi:hypothetical protein
MIRQRACAPVHSCSSAVRPAIPSRPPRRLAARGPVFSVVAPCQRGAWPFSVRRWTCTTDCWANKRVDVLGSSALIDTEAHERLALRCRHQPAAHGSGAARPSRATAPAPSLTKLHGSRPQPERRECLRDHEVKGPLQHIGPGRLSIRHANRPCRRLVEWQMKSGEAGAHRDMPSVESSFPSGVRGSPGASVQRAT